MNQTVWISCAMAAVTGAFGYFFKRLISGHDALRKDLEEEKKQTARALDRIRESYLRYDEFCRFQTSIEQKLTQIYDILVAKR